MVKKPVFQTGSTRIVPNFAIKMQRTITALTMERKFAFATGSEMRARRFATKVPHGTDAYLTVRSRVFPSGMALNVQFIVMTPCEKLTVVMALETKYVSGIGMVKIVPNFVMKLQSIKGVMNTGKWFATEIGLGTIVPRTVMQAQVTTYAVALEGNFVFRIGTDQTVLIIVTTPRHITSVITKEK